MLEYFQALAARIVSLRHSDEGQTLVEYGLIIVLVALVCAAGLTILAGGINDLFNDVASRLTSAGEPPASGGWG